MSPICLFFRPCLTLFKRRIFNVFLLAWHTSDICLTYVPPMCLYMCKVCVNRRDQWSHVPNKKQKKNYCSQTNLLLPLLRNSLQASKKQNLGMRFTRKNVLFITKMSILYKKMENFGFRSAKPIACSPGGNINLLRDEEGKSSNDNQMRTPMRS